MVLVADKLQYHCHASNSPCSAVPHAHCVLLPVCVSLCARAQARRSSRPGPDSDSSSSSSSSSSDEDSDDDASSSSSSFDASGGSSLEKPSAAVLKVAKVLASADKKAISQIAAEAQGLGFATQLVGEGGAGYEWPQTDTGFDPAFFSIAPPPMRCEHTQGCCQIPAAEGIG